MFRKIMPQRWAARVVLSLSAATLMACGETDLFSKPARSAGTAPPLPIRESIIGARVAVQLEAIQAALERTAPRVYTGVAKPKPEDRPCARGLFNARHCVDVEAPFTVTRKAFTVVQSDPASIRLVVPVNVEGQGKIKGSGEVDKLVIEALDLKAKNFKGAGTLTADIGIGLTEDWCLKPSVRLDISWGNNPELEIVSGVWIDVGGVVKPEVDKSLGRIRDELAQSLPCELVRTEVTKLLAPRSVPVVLPDGLGSMFVNVRPTTVGFSGVSVANGAAAFALQVAAETDIAPSALVVPPAPLPPLKTIEQSAPRIRLAVPMRVRYDVLTKAAEAQLAGKTFEVETPAGKARANVAKVEVYPSGSRVAVGIAAKLDVPGRWADVKGEIFVLGTPRVAGSVVSLKDFAFAQVVDNKAWDLVALVLRDRIVAEVDKAVRYDVAQESARVQNSLQEAVAKASKGGLVLKPLTASVGLGAVAVAAETLEVEATFEATLDATATQLVMK
jgi:Domain of unknown function (DUF4403)